MNKNQHNNKRLLLDGQTPDMPYFHNFGHFLSTARLV